MQFAVPSLAVCLTEFPVSHLPGLSLFAQGLMPRLEVTGWTWQTSNGQQLTR